MSSKAEKLLGVPLSQISVSRHSTSSVTSVFSGVSSYSSKLSVGSQHSDQKVNAMMNQQYEVLLTPLFIYMRVLGLTNYTDNPVLRYPLMIYNIVIIIIMNSYSLLIVSEIRFIGLDVDFAFATIHACYLASGGICSLFLFWMQRSFNRLSKIVIQQVGAYDPDFHQAARIHKMCKMMVGLIIFWAMVAVFTTTIIHKKLNNDEEKSLSNIILFLIHLYVAFLTQSALMSWSVFFVLPCNILAACVDAFAEDMHRDGIEKDDKWTNTEAVALVMHYKHRYRGLKKAADVIEEQFKFAIAYVDALCFTELCFILYTYLQDKSKDKTWIDMALCASYAVNSVFHMTLFTAPAYRLYERNQTTMATATVMFRKLLTRSHDQFLACLLLLFTHKLQAAEISFTAGGFFVVTRQLFLTLLSLVLTYVTIMLQFGQESNDCLLANATIFNQTIVI